MPCPPCCEGGDPCFEIPSGLLGRMLDYSNSESMLSPLLYEEIAFQQEGSSLQLVTMKKKAFPVVLLLSFLATAQWIRLAQTHGSLPFVLKLLVQIAYVETRAYSCAVEASKQ